MAKKKIKKPVSKRVTKTPRTTRATLDERNETLGQTAPKTRKPRTKKPKVVTTTEPAIETVWRSGSAEEFLDTADKPRVVWQTPSWVSSQEVSTEVQTVVPTEVQTSGSVFIANYPEQRVEFTKVNKNGWADAASEVYDDFISKMKKSDFTTQVRDFAFAHPLIFGIGFCTAVLFVVAAFGIASRIFGW